MCKKIIFLASLYQKIQEKCDFGLFFGTKGVFRKIKKFFFPYLEIDLHLKFEGSISKTVPGTGRTNKQTHKHKTIKIGKKPTPPQMISRT